MQMVLTYLLGEKYFVQTVVLNDRTAGLLILIPLEQEYEAMNGSAAKTKINKNACHQQKFREKRKRT